MKGLGSRVFGFGASPILSLSRCTSRLLGSLVSARFIFSGAALDRALMDMGLVHGWDSIKHLNFYYLLV